MSEQVRETQPFIVYVREVHTQKVTIDAADAEEAIQKVRDGEGSYIDDGLEYSHTLGKDNWTAEKAK